MKKRHTIVGGLILLAVFQQLTQGEHKPHDLISGPMPLDYYENGIIREAQPSLREQREEQGYNYSNDPFFKRENQSSHSRWRTREEEIEERIEEAMEEIEY